MSLCTPSDSALRSSRFTNDDSLPKEIVTILTGCRFYSKNCGLEDLIRSHDFHQCWRRYVHFLVECHGRIRIALGTTSGASTKAAWAGGEVEAQDLSDIGEPASVLVVQYARSVTRQRDYGCSISHDG